MCCTCKIAFCNSAKGCFLWKLPFEIPCGVCYNIIITGGSTATNAVEPLFMIGLKAGVIVNFEKEQYVVYGKIGVCRVVDRQMLAFGGAEKEEYYVLAPWHDPRSSIYVPCGNATLMARLRPLLTKHEIDAMLAHVPDEEILWIDDRGERASFFRTILYEGDRRQIVRLVRCIYAKKREKIADGKKLSAIDETFQQECIRLVEEEFAFALDIPVSQVEAYIRERLDDPIMI